MTASRRLRQDSDNRTRARHLARRIEVDGRLIAPVEFWMHGDRNTYTKRGCRCVPCTRAERDYRADYRGSPSATVRELVPCPSQAAYHRHLQRGEVPCAGCREARNAYERELYRAGREVAS